MHYRLILASLLRMQRAVHPYCTAVQLGRQFVRHWQGQDQARQLRAPVCVCVCFGVCVCEMLHQ